MGWMCFMAYGNKESDIKIQLQELNLATMEDIIKSPWKNHVASSTIPSVPMVRGCHDRLDKI